MEIFTKFTKNWKIKNLHKFKKKKKNWNPKKEKFTNYKKNKNW
jgi:hypothetical protein